MNRGNHREGDDLLEIIESLVPGKTSITIRIPGKKRDFRSSFLGLEREGAAGKKKDFRLILERIHPEDGNLLLANAKKAWMEFRAQGTLCRCQSRYLAETECSWGPAVVMTLPASLQMEEMRKEERITFEVSHFISAAFRVPGDTREDRTWELDVINWSVHGLGLLVLEKDQELVSLLRVGDQIPEITLFLRSALTKFDGVVRHFTKIEVGRHKGSHILGIRSEVPLDTSGFQDLSPNVG